jgi:glutathione S-transferase
MAAHIVLEEVLARFELVCIPVSEGATQQPAYLATNPKGRVPVLAIPGQDRVLTELPAILTYLARQYPEAQLLPADALAEARCHGWLAWLSGWVHGVGFGGIWRPGRFTAQTAHIDEIRAHGRRTVIDGYATIEQQFADGREWAAPSGFSIVDPFLLVLYRWGNRIGVDMRASYRAWTAHTARLRERPAVQRVLEREGVSIDG